MSKNFSRTHYGFIRTVCAALAFVSSVQPAQSQSDVSNLLLPPGSDTTGPSPSFLTARGELDVWVKLVDQPLAVVQGPNAKKAGGRLDAAQQRAYLQQLRQKQDSLMAQIQNLGGREIARVSKAYNAIAVAIDSSRLGALVALPGVATIRRVQN